MRKSRFTLTLLSLLAALTAAAQTPQAYQPPMDIKMLLSGNYGEIRNNHFHSGVDIRTGGRIGVPIHSVADGYVSRIAVSPYGMGNALYVTHRDGKMSVYAHLDGFSPEITDYVREYQYRNKSFGVNIFPPKDRFLVYAGDVIGYSGNSGSSRGPHLHFEFRDQASRPLNPITQGIISIEDDINPCIENLFVITIDTVQNIPVHTIRKRITVQSIDSTTVIPIPPNSYFAVELRDIVNNTNFVMSVTRLIQSIDDKVNFEINLNKFSFADTRYVNAVTLCPRSVRTISDVLRMHVAPNNPLPIYRRVVNRGMINLCDSAIHKLTLTAIDDADNRTILKVGIRLDSAKHEIAKCDGVPVPWYSKFNHSQGKMSLKMDPRTLYESQFINFAELPADKGALSPLYVIGDTDMAIQKPMTISIALDSCYCRLKDRLVIAQVDAQSGKMISVGGKCNQDGTSVMADVRSMGTYCIVADTIPPVIVPKYNATVPLRNAISFKIGDNLAGISSYTVTIGDNWELFEYDPKAATITHTFTPLHRLPVGKHKIKVVVNDAVGNQAVYEGEFIV